MRFSFPFCVLAVCFATGCASKFDGEWLENSGQHDTGNTLTEGGERRMAIQFCPPSLVRTGLYLDRTGVVDEQTVQESGYFLFDGWKVAQLGEMTATIHGNYMTASVQGGPERYFTKVTGKSIFPPRPIAPAWGAAPANTSPSHPQAVASATDRANGS